MVERLLSKAKSKQGANPVTERMRTYRLTMTTQLHERQVKNMYIDAIMWYFGFNKSQAEQYYKNLINNNELSTLDEILRGYKNQMTLAFYND